jgi:hypothetical protein
MYSIPLCARLVQLPPSAGGPSWPVFWAEDAPSNIFL